jgi:hypothetical protein
MLSSASKVTPPANGNEPRVDEHLGLANAGRFETQHAANRDTLPALISPQPKVVMTNAPSSSLRQPDNRPAATHGFASQPFDRFAFSMTKKLQANFKWLTRHRVEFAVGLATSSLKTDLLKQNSVFTANLCQYAPVSTFKLEKNP